MSAYPKMNQEVKKIWVEALRSGKYQQGRGKLKRSDDLKPTYCCLGVLCEVAYPNDANYHADLTVPTEETLKLAGLKYDGMDIKTFRKLWMMNDGHDDNVHNDGKFYNFKEIANWIEENL